MMDEALGTVEVRGWAAAIAAADAGVKAASVRIAGIDLTKGGGQVVVRFVGEVAAVRAAIEAAANVAAKVSKVIVTHVIPRPSMGADRRY
ncbi:MAG: BMC domain-containing protein [Ignavibacterium sp.]|nr:BMC domain-containing protein [Ignavibacterium sp.]